MSKPTLRGLALTAIQYDLYAAMRWLDEFKNDMADSKCRQHRVKHIKVALTIRLMI
jgi:hypothetical protein